MMSEELRKRFVEWGRKGGKKGGKQTLLNRGKNHFRDAANVRWAKYRKELSTAEGLHNK